MKRRSPLLGLLTFNYYSVRGSVGLDLLICLAIGVAAQILGHSGAMHLFVALVVTSAPFVVMVKGEGTAKWEQYQIAMPVTRKDLATSLYLNVFVAAVLGIPIIGFVWGLGFIFNETTFTLSIIQGINASFLYGFVLLTTALLYPLICTNFGKRKEATMMLICCVVAFAIVSAMSGAGNLIGLTSGVISLLIIAITGMAFIISLFITRAIYSKMNF